MVAVARLPAATIVRPRARRSRPDMRFDRAAAMRGQKKQRKREWQHAKARGGGAEREDVLQIERQIGHHDLSGGGEAEHGKARAEKRALAKEREIHHRPFLDKLGRDKERKQDSGRQELCKRLFRRPTHAVGPDQRPDETKEAGAKRQHAHNVQSLRVRIARLLDGIDREPDEDIGAHHPFDIGEGRIEIAGDGRQRDRDDVRIEHDHERHARGAKQDARSPPAHPSHWTLSRLRRGCQSLLRHDAALRSVWPSRGS